MHSSVLLPACFGSSLTAMSRFTRPPPPQEDALILRGHAALGARWTEIAKLLPGRTDNAIKNRWNGTLSKAAQEAGQVPGQPTVLSGLCLAASLETDPSPECN